MKKLRSLKIISLFFIITVLVVLAVPGHVSGWSGVTLNNTHKAIDGAAYNIIGSGLTLSSVRFPSFDAISQYDYVYTNQTGTGPDVPGKTNGGDHFYNPRREAQNKEAGGGPDMVEKQFLLLVSALQAGDTAKAAQPASWVAHFAADLCMPYHTQGASRTDIMAIYTKAGGKNAPAVSLPPDITGPLGLFTSITDPATDLASDLGLIKTNTGYKHSDDFKTEIEAFIAGSAKHAATEDWFDPWYWDGRVYLDGLLLDAMKTSSHVTYEGITFAMPGSTLFGLSPAVTKYSDLWTNPTPGFDNVAGKQAALVREFARKNAVITQSVVDGMDGVVTSADPFLVSSIEAAATVWRASYSALVPGISFSVPDKNEPKLFKVTGQVNNTDAETAVGARYKLTITGGTLKSGKLSGELDDIGGGYGRALEWEVEASGLGYCSVKLEVIGSYTNTPDLQYAVTEVTAPGILPVAVTNTSPSRSHSIVFCLDNSSSMSGQPIVDAMNAGVQAVTSAVGSELEMALYFFGTNGCDPPVRKVDFTVDRERIKAAMKTARAVGSTPLAAAITAAGEYIHSSARGEAATIILLTDGMETCNGNPLAAARALNPNVKLKSSLFARPVYAASDTPIKLQVVGFNIQSAADENTLKEIAQAGNGSYYPAADVKQLAQAMNQAIEEGTGAGFKFQTWWFIAAGALVLLIIVITLARRGKRTPAPAAAPAGVAYTAPAQTAPGPAANTPPAASFCPSCGTRIQKDASFCTGCGKPVVVQGPAFCFHCGAPVTSGSLFCGKCGASLTAAISGMAVSAAAPAAAPPQAAVPPQAVTAVTAAKPVSGLWWLIAIFLLLPGGLIAWAVVRKDNPRKAVQFLAFSLFITIFVIYAIVQNMA
jgi:Mg-chelatase subunit ChlD